MRDVEIIATKTQYKAGETVEGHVIIKCDDDFKHNGIHITFKGREHTRIVVSTGKTTHVHTDEHVYFEDTSYLQEAGSMQAGEKRLPFSFQFPDNSEGTLSSYSGRNGWIEYTLEAVVEISWASDLKEKKDLDFRQAMEKLPQQLQHQCAERDGYPVLDVEIENNSFCLGDPVSLRFRVAHDAKIREVRVELKSDEIVHAGKLERNSWKTLAKQSIDDDEVQRGVWMDIQLDTDESMQATFNRPIIRNEVSLKVTLNIPWGQDESVEIPITLGFCNNQLEKETYDIFDF
ncbi:MAG: hypothetical protein JW779_00615 [Candidatus Thorarchaeota archaeon]|nr:hypothetical protein [Candidatus Thorarchaeota archaeon]